MKKHPIICIAVMLSMLQNSVYLPASAESVKYLCGDLNSDGKLDACLAQNPCYRNCMTAKGYFQSHMLDYYLGTGMEMPQTPDISIIPKAAQ